MPPDGRLYFSFYELLGVMRKARKGDNYRELRAALLRLSATHFQANNAFFLKDKNKLATRTFTLWDVSFDIEVDNETGKATERHFLEFNNVVRQSFQAEYLKTLDSDFYFSLRSPLAKRLYRLIDRKRQGKPRWGTSLDKLKDMAPLAPSYKTPSKIRDVLETAHGELKRRGFLAGISYEKHNGSHWVRWRVEPEFDRRRSLKSRGGGLALDAVPDEDERQAITLLVDKKVWANVARDLVRRHGPEACRLQVESLRFQRGVEDPPAWLRWAIETGHPLPNHLRPQPSLVDDSETDYELFRTYKTERQDATSTYGYPDLAARDVWDGMLDGITDENDSSSLLVWFEGTVPTALCGERLTIVVPNSFAKEYIETRFLVMLEEALREQTGAPHATLEVAVQPGAKD